MKKILAVLSIVGMVLIASSQAQAALMFYTNRTAWETAVGTFIDIDIASQVIDGATLSAGTPLTSGGHSLTFNVSLEGRQVPIPTSWATWSGGHTPRVLYTSGAMSLTATFSDDGPNEFGLEMEPNPYTSHNMTLFLSNGSTLTQSINGNGGAGFFGWAGDEDIANMTLSSDVDFAFGRLVYTEGAVPEPATLSLLGLGLLGLLGLGRKK